MRPARTGTRVTRATRPEGLDGRGRSDAARGARPRRQTRRAPAARANLPRRATADSAGASTSLPEPPAPGAEDCCQSSPQCKFCVWLVCGERRGVPSVPRDQERRAVTHRPRETTADLRASTPPPADDEPRPRPATAAADADATSSIVRRRRRLRLPRRRTRLVIPYPFDFVCHVKARHAGVDVVAMFAKEFSARDRGYYEAAHLWGTSAWTARGGARDTSDAPRGTTKGRTEATTREVSGMGGTQDDSGGDEKRSSP